MLTLTLWWFGDAANAQGIRGDEGDSVSTVGKQPELLFGVDGMKSTSAISSVSGQTAFKTPASNLTNTLYGLLPGLAVTQGSGELGYDMAMMAIRGNGTFNKGSLTVYIDGFQTDPSYVAYLLPSEVDRIYVLKDAAPLALFGMNGANGVLWIETRRGSIGETTVDVNLRTGWQSPQRISKPLGSESYARLYNEAVSNDNGMVWNPYYSDQQIESYRLKQGTDVDWYDEVLKPVSPFSSSDISIRGGSESVRFFAMLGYVNSNGFYDVDRDDVRSNQRFDQYSARVNLDFKTLRIFEGKVNIGGQVLNNKGPNFSNDQLWYNMATYPNNIYNIYDEVADNDHWSGTTIHPDNPVASIKGLGYRSNRDRSFQANFSLKESLDMVLPGLYVMESGSFATWTRGSYNIVRNYTRWHNGTAQTTDSNTDYVPEDDYGTNQWTWNQFRVQTGYERAFGVHNIHAAVNYEHYKRFVDTNLNGSAGDNTTYARQAVNGRVNYSFDSRFVGELGFSYFGSDNYADGNRFQFYPSISGAWILSNESFLNTSEKIDFLKMRVSAGLSGYDYYEGGRYLYYQYYVNGPGFPTGNAGDPTYNSSLIPAYLADPNLSAEKSTKYNAGFDARFLNAFAVTLDAFVDKRSDIIAQDNFYPAGLGINPPYSNIGKVTTRGVELSLNYEKAINQVSFSVGAMTTYVKDEIVFMSEILPASADARKTGNSLGSVFGYEANGFYDIGDFDANGVLVNTLPMPTFGVVQPGDVKYRDRNRDMIVDERDMTKISDGANPNLYYSLFGSVAFKGFDFRFVFQGIGDRDVNLMDAQSKVVAFRDNTTAYPIALDRWAYYPSQGIDTRSTAKYPRLSAGENTNNYVNSTLWIANGSFLKLRNVEFGYTIPTRISNKVGMRTARLYVNGVNLLTFSHLTKKYDMDPENMTGYPAVKSYNIGVSVGF